MIWLCDLQIWSVSCLLPSLTHCLRVHLLLVPMEAWTIIFGYYRSVLLSNHLSTFFRFCGSMIRAAFHAIPWLFLVFMQTFFCYDPLFPFSFSCENVFNVETICILLEENFILYTETSKQGPPSLWRTHCCDVI